MPTERDCVDHLTRVAGKPHLSLPESIALAWLVARKWDRARTTWGRADVSSVEVAEFDNFTPAELDEFRAAASRALVEYAATLPRSGDRWWRGVGQGFAASWFYAFSIAIAAVIIRLSGSDVLTLLRELFGK